MEANSAAAPVHINWRRFIMVDSPYRWITLGIWRGEIAVRVLVCSYLITGIDVCARLSRRRAIDHREDVSEPPRRRAARRTRRASFNHLIGEREQTWRHVEA